MDLMMAEPTERNRHNCPSIVEVVRNASATARSTCQCTTGVRELLVKTSTTCPANSRRLS